MGPVTACSAVANSVVLWFGALWLSALVVGRVYTFHDSYATIIQRVERDAELRSRCMNPSFVALLHDHPLVCTLALHEADVNPWLHALNDALNAPTLCGTESCMDVLHRTVARGGWVGLGLVMLVVLMSPQLLLSCLRRPPPPIPISAMYPVQPSYKSATWLGA